MTDFNYVTKLEYRKGDRFCPIPEHEKALPTVVAEPFVQAVDHFGDLEGVHFNRDGSILYFCNCVEDKVMAVDMNTKEVSTVLEVNNYIPNGYIAAVKVHKDGRLFVAYLTLPTLCDGGIFYCNPDGTGFYDIPIAKGIAADDMCFDSEGNIYVTDMCGVPTNRKGTIEWISKDFTVRKTVMGNMATPNGLTLSTDEKMMWVTDTACGELIRTELMEALPDLKDVVLHQSVSDDLLAQAMQILHHEQ